MKYIIVTLVAASALFTSCVPKDQYNAVVTELNYYRNESERADSIESQTAISTYNSAGNETMEMQRRIQQVESLTATNLSLNRSFQDLRERYDDQLQQNKLLLEQNGTEVTALQQSLADRAQQISEQEQLLRQKEIELQSREAQLAQLAPSTAAPAAYGSVATPTPFGQTAPAFNDQQNAALQQNQLQGQLGQSLIGYPRNEVKVAAEGTNKVVVTLAQGQLFADGFVLSQDGRSLLSRVAAVLRSYPTAQVQVIGHSDAAVEAVAAYENSTDRAIAVSQAMIGNGVNPQSITVAGKGYYSPVAGNNTPADRAANRRTEIVITL